MRKSTLMVAALLLLTGLVHAADPAPPPSGPPPDFMTVAEKKTAEGHLHLYRFVQVPVTEIRKRVIEQDGRKVEVEEAVTRMVVKTEAVALALKDIKAQTADGKALTGDDLARRLAPGSVVLTTYAVENLAPAFLKVVKADTVIITLPTIKFPLPPPPEPLPPNVKPLPIERKP